MEKKAQKSKKRKPTNKDNLQARKRKSNNKIVANDGRKKIKIPQQYSIKSLIPLYFQFHFLLLLLAYSSTSSARH
jgi:hypothetical protein